MELKAITIAPEHYTGKDIEYISDTICDILAECHGIHVDTLSFEIKVTYTTVEDEDE